MQTEERHHATHWMHKRFTTILLMIYALACIWPEPGIWLKSRAWNLSDQRSTSVSISMILLCGLFFTTGLSLESRHASRLGRNRTLPFQALMLRLLLTCFWSLFWMLGRILEAPDAIQYTLAALCLIACMPTAGSSMAWAHQSGANLLLSLVMLLVSLAMTPLLAGWIGFLFEAGKTLHPESFIIQDSRPSAFFPRLLTLCVMAPIILGYIMRQFLTPRQGIALRRVAKPASTGVLLLLNYMHASSFLPHCMQTGTFTLLIPWGICLIGACTLPFLTASWFAAMRRLHTPERLSILFAIGLNNTGLALVIASESFHQASWVGATIAFCTLGQHLVAGRVQQRLEWRKAPCYGECKLLSTSPTAAFPFQNDALKAPGSVALMKASVNKNQMHR